MTQGRLLLATGMTGYILADVRLEERDLIATFGEAYRTYRTTTPLLSPRLPAIVVSGTR